MKSFNHLTKDLKLKRPLRYFSSRKVGLRGQASSEQADGPGKPHVNREMLPIHCHAWTCLSSATLECTSPAKRFPLKTVNEKKFLSTQQIHKKLNSTPMSEHKTDMNITKIEKYKKTSMTEHKTDMNITKIEKHTKKVL